MVSQSSSTPGESTESVVLVMGFGDPAAADHASFAGRSGCGIVGDEVVCRLIEAPVKAFPFAGSIEETSRPLSVVLWLPPRLTDADRAALDAALTFATQRNATSVILVSSLAAHLGDSDALAVEAYASQRAGSLRRHTTIIRAGHVLSKNSRLGTRLRRLAGCSPLVPRSVRTCCVEGDELFAMIEAVRKAPRTRRLYVLLGPNRPWKDLLSERRSGVLGGCLWVVCFLLSLLLVGRLATLVFRLFARRRPALQSLDFDTLLPRSLRELVALSNPYNRRHVRVVGYNNGVNHFGHRYPGRTVVSTVLCNRVGRAGPDAIRADCGVTVRKALDFLAPHNQELYVIPNYSYVCLGTAFFVPIHGSAADFSTIADTLAEAVLYDPATDRIVRAKRDEPLFRDNTYNAKSDVIVLRLRINVKTKSRYFMREEELDGPSADFLLNALRDKQAANVEVRKSKASDSKARLIRFYNDSSDTAGPVQELPRDKLGRLWDKLEENPITSFLMHALTRHLAFHCELFFTDEEFRTFWTTCAGQGLRKIQLRYIRRDGFPHSPFRDHDCVSADLFMFRRNRQRFEEYLRQTFAVVRSNPGKHSA